MTSRTRSSLIKARPWGTRACFICGKDKCKRGGKYPAPIYLLLRITYLFSRKLDAESTIGGDVCMACAKRLSEQLDTAIEHIENGYYKRESRQ